MCGIAGRVDFDRDLTRERETAQAMTDTLADRGPDDGGLWMDRHVALGHRRLSVIDIEGGKQPMTAVEHGRELAVLAYSGEVYNFRELRGQLESYGHRFHTTSDTEVVLRAYLHWGVELVDHLNGMYAFGIWDPVREELLLVRDRMGVKPLYYFPTRHGVLFGSEPKAILADPNISRTVEIDGLREVLDVVKTPGHAIYAGMHEVLAGELVRVNRSGLHRRRYWQLRAWPHPDDLPTTIRTVRELLEDIVTRQLVSDVPLCSLLSGGLDSSAVAAMAGTALAAGGAGRLRTFAVDFEPADNVQPAPDTADPPFAREMARYARTEHNEVLLDNRGLLDTGVRAAVQRAMDLPLNHWGDMWVSLHLLFRAVRERSTVALSGEAADEVFCGYPFFHDPRSVWEDAFPWIGAPGRYFDGTTLLDRGLLRKLDIPGYRRMRYWEAVGETPVLPGEDGIERRMRELCYLTLTRFLRVLLDRKDRMSMASGLEVRVPFCDHRLVEYVFNVPWSMKTFDGREKSLLRAATADLLPGSVRNRAKRGYPMTDHPGYAQGIRDELAGLVAEGDAPVLPLLDGDRVREFLRRPVEEVSRQYDRGGIETALGLNVWLTANQITLDL
ncbi:asparagine synthase (glutamine-hydrolyzing) [Amycolatopsis aidingensis]|uniref:asparagine synthase (glutamine-hydrolyzing) n=1 Tax=Amycolatopsis aidingensis TaxID=2842453 RepID=UPI001C0C2609|nr:asparagine synthase (glutamine-hydrolyzing) [Amycolatopsis aidingensis]